MPQFVIHNALVAVYDHGDQQAMIKKILMNIKFLIAGFLSVIFLTPNLNGQYFGRNKPVYESFDFKVVQTPHFEFYHYLDNDAFVDRFITQAEIWYQQHQGVLHDTIRQKNPLILYANHPDFQQTNAISSRVSVGTGGVTEAFKNRVVMPIAMSNQQTHHVLGHELVHAYQYNMILNGDSTNLSNLANLPLWMVEGLAEYLSIGSVDAHTAMWMRDAVLHDDFPTFKDLRDPKYFPYRYGQMFWVFVTGLKGDEIIRPLFEETAKYGFDAATRRVLGIKSDDLSKLWKESIEAYYQEMIGDRTETFVGKEIINHENGGKINVAPEISPNGRFVIFLSEKDVFNIDLFVAEARTGKIIRKVSSRTRGTHIDDFNYIESSGTWSPRSTEFAYVGVAKGDNILIVSEVETGQTILETTIPGVPAFSNPTWSPDGKTIVVSGLVNGQVDLYAFDIRTKRVTQLTNDVYSELHPAWSANGEKLLFATDARSLQNNQHDHGKLHYNIASLTIASGDITQFSFFAGADNLNPEEDQDGNIVFLSNRDGYRNLYRYSPETEEIAQLTDLLTGVSGITHYAPAFSIDRKRNRLVYTYFSQQGYRLFQAGEEDLLSLPIAADAVDMSAAQLLQVNKKAPLIVDEALSHLHEKEEAMDSLSYTETNYKPQFKLDYLGGGGGVGIGTSNTFGSTTGLSGGIDMMFSDILGHNQLFSSLYMNGELIDIGGVIGFVNRKNSIHWGASLSHLPFRSFAGSEFQPLDTISGNNGDLALVDRLSVFETRYFEEKLGVFAQYPISTTLRVETNASYSLYSGRLDRRDYFYQPNSFFLVGQDRTKVESLPGFNIGRIEAALVGDNSSFGMAAPLNGRRFRLGVERYFDAFNFTGVTADYRAYKFLRPVSLAGRITHNGRYGGNSEDLFPQFLGYPWHIRGLNSAGQEVYLASGRNIDELLGSKILVASGEVRLPFTGPEQLALIPSKAFFSDLNLFVDAGMAWTKNDQLKGDIFTLDRNGDILLNPETGEPIIAYNRASPIVTVGASLRINLFGALIVEPYYAVPLVKNTRGVFGINLVPGW